MGSAAGAASAGGRPTAIHPLDVGLLAVVGGITPLAASRARRSSLLLLAMIAAATARAWATPVGAVALLVAGLASRRRRRSPLAGAVVGALGIQVLLRQPPFWCHGAPSMAAAVAVVPVLVSAHRRSPPVLRRATAGLVAVVAAFVVAATATFAAAFVMAVPHLRVGSADGRAALALARDGSTGPAARQLRAGDAELEQAAALTGSWWARPARLVPIVGQHVAAVARLADAGRRATSTAPLIDALGDYRALKLQSGRIDLPRVAALTQPLDAAIGVLDAATREARVVNRSWLAGPLVARLDGVRAELAGAAEDARRARELTVLLPRMLGADGPRHWLVAFLNPAEERGAGGFVGSYGQLDAVHGRISLGRAGSTSDLHDGVDAGRRRLDGPAEFLARYGRYRPAQSMRDASSSPNFPYDADVLEQLYPQAGGVPLDGVISVDPKALAALLRFIGPISVPGSTTAITWRNANDELVRRQYLAFGDRGNVLRKDLLATLTAVTFDRLLRTGLPSPRRLAAVLGPMVRERRIMLHAVRPEEQRLFARIHADGAMPRAGGGDVFMVADQNYGNDKLDAYLWRSVEYRARVDPATGTVRSTATVSLHNDAPAVGLPPYVIGNSRHAPAGTNVLNLTAYSPLRLATMRSDGQPIAFEVGEEAGLNAYTVRVAVPPQSTVTLVLQLAGAVALPRGVYHLQVMPQPSVRPDVVAVSAWVAGGPPPGATAPTINGTVPATRQPRVAYGPVDYRVIVRPP